MISEDAHISLRSLIEARTAATSSALTSGARVGLLRVPRTERVGRVVKGMDSLADEGWAMWFEDWRTKGALRAAPAKLDEASRVAQIVVERLGLSRGAP